LRLSAKLKVICTFKLKLEGKSQNIDTIERLLNRANAPAYNLAVRETQKI
jgi:hypothetical protein